MASQLCDAARVATLTDHLEDTSGAKAGIAFQSLLNEVVIRSQFAQSIGATTEPVDLDGSSDRIVMKAKLGGDGPDFPVFGIKEPANLDHEFLGNHHHPPSSTQTLCRPHL
jgi:hypothetical protein